MPTNVRPIPDGYHSVTPYLVVDDAARAIEFYRSVFGATEITRFTQPDGRIGHAELRIGDSVVMLADAAPDIGARSPRSIGGTPVTISVYVEDADAVVQRALDGGAQLVRPVENQFYGDRAGGIVDPFGHSWHVATHVEDVPEDELRRRAAEQHLGA
jgi:PhnB protein